MKGVKVATMVGIIVEMLKSGDISIIDWLLRIFKRCIESCVSSRYTNGKVRRECDKLQRNKYIKYTQKDVQQGINQKSDGKYEIKVAKNQGGFRFGWGCKDQIFVLKQCVNMFFDVYILGGGDGWY